MSHPASHSIPILESIERDATPESARILLDVATDFLADTRDGAGRVSTAHIPESLVRRFDEPIPSGERSLREIAERLRDDVVSDSNALYHPMYMGHQTAAPLPAAIWTEPLVSALNQSLAVWEMSPVATAIERQVIRWLTTLVGWGPESGGTLASGGTEATFTALLAARNSVIPNAWRDGVGAPAPVVLCGEHSHYATARAVGELGLGVRSLITVPSSGYAMDVAALARILDELATARRTVMAVVATAGSTATGSFDDLEAIGALCESRNIWLHVDGAHGASALLSPARRHQLAGLHFARSLAWDPHKGMFLPLGTGMLLMRDERDMELAFAQEAPYLFHAQNDAETDAGEPPRRWDIGTRSFQCSRRADVLKLWVALQRYGADGIGRVYDYLCDLTRLLYDAIAERADFEALHEPESNILCFRYLGDRSLDAAAVDQLNRALRARYNRSGHGWITLTVLDGRPVLRVTLMNHRTRVEHVHQLLAGLAGLAA